MATPKRRNAVLAATNTSIRGAVESLDYNEWEAERELRFYPPTIPYSWTAQDGQRAKACKEKAASLGGDEAFKTWVDGLDPGERAQACMDYCVTPYGVPAWGLPDFGTKLGASPKPASIRHEWWRPLQTGQKQRSSVVMWSAPSMLIRIPSYGRIWEWKTPPSEVLAEGGDLAALCKRLYETSPDTYPKCYYNLPEALGHPDLFAYLPSLIFDYWGNTEDRYRILNNGFDASQDPGGIKVADFTSLKVPSLKPKDASTNSAAAGRSTVVVAPELPFDGFKDFVLLDHQIESAEGPKLLSDLWTELQIEASSELDAALKTAATKDAGVGSASFAVIDLTENTPRYAGHNDDRMLDPASTGKTVLMLGAFQLRYDLAVLAKREGIKDAGTLFDRAEERWARVGISATETESFNSAIDLMGPRGGQFIRAERWRLVKSKGKTIPMVSSAGVDFGQVKLDRIFDEDGGVTPPRFKQKFDDHGRPLSIGGETPYGPVVGRDGRTRESLMDYEEPQPARTAIVNTELEFWDWLRLMMAWSSNEAAECIVHTMGMVQANSPAWRAGLFDREHGGIWLGDDYFQPVGRIWRKPPFLTPGSHFTMGKAMSARALAILFAAIFTKKVVDEQSCKEMQELLHTHRDRSPIKEALSSLVTQKKLSGDVLDYYSKLGIDYLKQEGDTAYIVRSDADGKTCKYVLSVLPTSQQARQAVVKAVDDAILSLTRPQSGRVDKLEPIA